MTERSLFWQMMLALPCTYCNAKPGENCRSKTGRRAEFHADRFYAAKDQGSNQ